MVNTQLSDLGSCELGPSTQGRPWCNVSTRNLVKCIGCGALVKEIADGATHRYLGASPGCWAIFGQVLAKEYESARHGGQPDRHSGVHRLTVDAYCVQHPGVPSKQTIQSVAVHLISLYSVLERGHDAEKALRLIRRAVSHSEKFFWLEPPMDMGATTVVDVRRARTFFEHERLVRKWAEASWAAWSEHHAQIRSWAAL